VLSIDMPETLTITAADGYPLQVERHAPAVGRAERLIVIAPALGVAPAFYRAYAAFLAQRAEVVTIVWRGSEPEHARAAAAVLADWGRLDLEAVLGWAAARHGRRVLVGHSAGAQLVGLAPSSATLDALVLVAGSAPHARHYAGATRWRFDFLWRAWVPLRSLGRRRRYPPGSFGVAGTPLPAGVLRQWAQWARRPDYLFDRAAGLDLGGYRALRMPVLALRADDDDYVSAAAEEALLAQLPHARIERRVLHGDGQALGHFGYFRKANAALWQDTVRWLDAPRLP
ncbi:MAG: alpha/beta hydrolase family protein, partial [Solimonas sp.]